mmetsp:Transcript_21157/g.42388  ORF Transcript_21157/g.42388 Transcript_21157/m.42388 type:complete len:232 (-) Transcript_21157:74-769(-)
MAPANLVSMIWNCTGSFSLRALQKSRITYENATDTPEFRNVRRIMAPKRVRPRSDSRKYGRDREMNVSNCFRVNDFPSPSLPPSPSPMGGGANGSIGTPETEDTSAATPLRPSARKSPGEGSGGPSPSPSPFGPPEDQSGRGARAPRRETGPRNSVGAAKPEADGGRRTTARRARRRGGGGARTALRRRRRTGRRGISRGGCRGRGGAEGDARGKPWVPLVVNRETQIAKM